MTWFWSSPQWATYCQAYGAHGPIDNYRPDNIVVPLGPDDEMLARMRYDHRTTIKRRLDDLFCEIIEQPGTPLFRRYQELHELDAGRKTRPQATFDIMDSWLGSHAFLLLAYKNNVHVGAALFIYQHPGAYYASAARRPGVEGPIHHFLIWQAMRTLAHRGFEYLDLGHPETPAIAEFKRGFVRRGQ